MDRYIAVCMGEASGVSPELVLKALNNGNNGSFGGVILVGDKALFQKVAFDLNLDLPFTCYVKNKAELKKAQEDEELYIFYELELIDLKTFSYGKISAQTGMATYQCAKMAIELILNGYACALVTLPLNGKALSMAGLKERSYEDMLLTFAAQDTSVRMLDTAGIKIFTNSSQKPLRDALCDITFEKVLDTIIQVDAISSNNFVFDQLLPLGISTINPHHEDSEGYEKEELEAVIPAVEAAKKIGINIEGPIESHYLIHGAKEYKYKAIITLCYEQAIIAATAYNFNKTVLVIWGWPFLVVSYDRGAALAQAGRGIANEEGVLTALEVAYSYVQIGVNS